jgi:malate dehydrogenase
VAFLSKGDYGIQPGIMFGYPIRTKADGTWEIVQGLPLDAFSREKISLTENELLEERKMASESLGVTL